jgi:hypothetical protein
MTTESTTDRPTFGRVTKQIGGSRMATIDNGVLIVRSASTLGKTVKAVIAESTARLIAERAEKDAKGDLKKALTAEVQRVTLDGKQVLTIVRSVRDGGLNLAKLAETEPDLFARLTAEYGNAPIEILTIRTSN